MLRYTTARAWPGLVALYDIWQGNAVGQFLQPRSLHGAQCISNQIIYASYCIETTMQVNGRGMLLVPLLFFLVVNWLDKWLFYCKNVIKIAVKNYYAANCIFHSSIYQHMNKCESTNCCMKEQTIYHLGSCFRFRCGKSVSEHFRLSFLSKCLCLLLLWCRSASEAGCHSSSRWELLLLSLCLCLCSFCPVCFSSEWVFLCFLCRWCFVLSSPSLSDSLHWFMPRFDLSFSPFITRDEFDSRRSPFSCFSLYLSTLPLSRFTKHGACTK